MASDIYLQIDGIKGESTDSLHSEWIEISSANWSVTQPKSATASTGGGHTTERCEHRTLSLTKLADLSSPVLMQTWTPATMSTEICTENQRPAPTNMLTRR